MGGAVASIYSDKDSYLPDAGLVDTCRVLYTRESLCFLSFRNPSEGAVNHRHPLPCTRRMAADKALFSAAKRTLRPRPLDVSPHRPFSFVPKQTENGAELRSWGSVAPGLYTSVWINFTVLPDDEKREWDVSVYCVIPIKNVQKK